MDGEEIKKDREIKKENERKKERKKIHVLNWHWKSSAICQLDFWIDRLLLRPIRSLEIGRKANQTSLMNACIRANGPWLDLFRPTKLYSRQTGPIGQAKMCLTKAGLWQISSGQIAESRCRVTGSGVCSPKISHLCHRTFPGHKSLSGKKKWFPICIKHIDSLTIVYSCSVRSVNTAQRRRPACL